jgi:hypothetical protein
MKLLVFLSFTALAQTGCPSFNHIFLIHGISGNAKSFGKMENYLKSTDDCYKIHSFEYETGNSALSTYDFFASFDQYITKKLTTKK